MSVTRSSDEVGTVSNPVTDHDTKRNGKLLKRHQGTSDFWWAHFGIVERNNLQAQAIVSILSWNALDAQQPPLTIDREPTPRPVTNRPPRM